MSRPIASRAALLLFRALIERSGAPKNRIFLTNCQSVDWQSLTFIGERHELELRIVGEDAEEIAARITDGLGEAEFSLPGLMLADIALAGRAIERRDGTVQLDIEALTLESA